MIQLIVDGVSYPETSHDKYKCYESDLSESMRMSSGRLVTEVRAKITVIEYSYDYFQDTLMKQCLSALRGNRDIKVEYLDPGDRALKSGVFRCTKWPAPSFAFSAAGKPMWHNISFTLESVEGK